MVSPASSTIGVRPRSRTWAAAARPTGPAPMIATVFSLITFSRQTGNIEIRFVPKLCRGLGVLGFGGVGAAFGHQEIHQLPHHVVVGVTDERGCFPDLRH